MSLLSFIVSLLVIKCFSATDVLYFPAKMSIQTAHVRLEEITKPSFRSDPNVNLHVILFML